MRFMDYQDEVDYNRTINDKYISIERNYNESYCQACALTTHHDRETGICKICSQKGKIDERD